MVKRIMRWLGYMSISKPLDVPPCERAGDDIHKLDPNSIEAFDDGDCDALGGVVINIRCKLCGRTAATEIDPKELLWN